MPHPFLMAAARASSRLGGLLALALIGAHASAALAGSVVPLGVSAGKDARTQAVLAVQGDKALSELRVAVMSHPELAVISTPGGALNLLTPEGQQALSAPIIDKGLPVLSQKLAENLPLTSQNLELVIDAYGRKDWGGLASEVKNTATGAWAEIRGKLAK